MNTRDCHNLGHVVVEHEFQSSITLNREKSHLQTPPARENNPAILYIYTKIWNHKSRAKAISKSIPGTTMSKNSKKRNQASTRVVKQLLATPK